MDNHSDLEDNEEIDAAQALEPDLLDSWLRRRLGRRLVVAGLTLTPGQAPTHDNGTSGGDAEPEIFSAALSTYRELWVVWAPTGTRLDDALAHAAAHDADALLVWLPGAAGSPDGEPGVPPAPTVQALRTLLEAAESLGLRDRCMLALAGPGASRVVARRLGFDDGFGLDVTPAQVAAVCAREAVSRAEFPRSSSSPPCYL
jgi:hypothetical protein